MPKPFFRPVTLIAIAVLAVLAASLSFAAPASAGTVDDEQFFFQRINSLRTSVGQPALQDHPELKAQARIWSQNMSNKNQLYHASDLSVGVSADWRVLGENVGVHSVKNLDQLFDAFVQSPTHYNNMVDPRFQYMGIGVVYSPDGSIWVTQRFMKVADSPPPVTLPPTTQAPVTVAPSTTVAAPPTTQPTAVTAATQPPTTQPPTTVSLFTTTSPTQRSSTNPTLGNQTTTTADKLSTDTAPTKLAFSTASPARDSVALDSGLIEKLLIDLTR